MKICIFFDGQNFYRSLQRFDEGLRVDYDRLAVWITQTVGGRTGALEIMHPLPTARAPRCCTYRRRCRESIWLNPLATADALQDTGHLVLATRRGQN